MVACISINRVLECNSALRSVEVAVPARNNRLDGLQKFTSVGVWEGVDSSLRLSKKIALCRRSDIVYDINEYAQNLVIPPVSHVLSLGSELVRAVVVDVVI
jgi:hypothetical protein